MNQRSVIVAVVVAATVLVVVNLSGGSGSPTLAPAGSVELGLSPGASILDLEPAVLEGDLQLMAELGVTSLRLDFDWSRIERTPGRFDWERTDTVVEAAADRGIAVHGLLAYTPAWARPGGATDKHPPQDVEAFARFAAEASERYQGAGLSSWEVWNEPNIERFWETGADPAWYARLFRATADAIRSVDPDAVVITGGLAPARDRDGDLSPLTFLRRMFDELEPGQLDGVAIHPYSYPARPSDRSKNWNLFGQLPAIQGLVAEAEEQPVPIWLTEFGAPTGAADNAVSEADQAAMVREALSCVGRLPWSGPLYLYNLRDRPGGDIDDAEDNFGLFTADGQPKASAVVVRELQDAGPEHLVESACEGW
ncbi:MAG: cellulase family glycosylhydrolase [Acidimicrobiales bacterium]